MHRWSPSNLKIYQIATNSSSKDAQLPNNTMQYWFNTDLGTDPDHLLDVVVSVYNHIIYHFTYMNNYQVNNSFAENIPGRVILKLWTDKTIIPTEKVLSTFQANLS